MESASNTSVILDASAPARRAGMTESEWREAIKFDSTDTGWVIMSIGMAIGAGIVFLPVQVGLMGLWVFLLSSIIGYPAMYLFQRLFINTLAESPECKDYPSVISGYLGKNWGILLGALYFVIDAPRDKCAHFREINGIAAAFQHLQKNYIPAALSFL